MFRYLTIALAVMAVAGCGKQEEAATKDLKSEVPKNESPRAKLIRESEALQEGQDAIVFDIGEEEVEVNPWGKTKAGKTVGDLKYLKVGTKVRFLGKLEANSSEDPHKQTGNLVPRAKILMLGSDDRIAYINLWRLKPIPKD